VPWFGQRPHTCNIETYDTSHLGAWYSAAAGLICGSRPLPEDVSRSIGISCERPRSEIRDSADRSSIPTTPPG
jgi:hypothetical protein